MTMPSAGREPHRATGASLAAVVLALVCFGAVMSLHVVRADLDPLRRVMSEYANGAHGVMMTVAFYAFGLACIALSVRLRREMAPTRTFRLVLALLVIAGAGLVLSGVFEVGRALVPDTIEESVHSIGSITAFLSLIAAMLLFSFVAREFDDWRSFTLVSWPLALVAATAAALSPVVTGPSGAGIVQRVLGGSVLLWLLLVARRIRVNAFRPVVGR